MDATNQRKTKCEEMEILVEKWIRRKRNLPGERKIMYVKHLCRK